LSHAIPLLSHTNTAASAFLTAKMVCISVFAF
jgi:hypothetical protein